MENDKYQVKIFVYVGYILYFLPSFLPSFLPLNKGLNSEDKKGWLSRGSGTTSLFYNFHHYSHFIFSKYFVAFGGFLWLIMGQGERFRFLSKNFKCIKI
ncbi:hypothetical protein PG661_02135 [Riemerella anatipestifer]|nr:hypothetical protein [Riemerella anatipestifer]